MMKVQYLGHSDYDAIDIIGEAKNALCDRGFLQREKCEWEREKEYAKSHVPIRGNRRPVEIIIEVRRPKGGKMTDQAQVARVCRAMGVEKTQGWCHKASLIPIRVEIANPMCGANPIWAKNVSCGDCGYLRTEYPTGPALLEALKGKLMERGYCYQPLLSPAGCGVSVWKYGVASTGVFAGKADTELDALLAACEQAFCGEGKS